MAKGDFFESNISYKQYEIQEKLHGISTRAFHSQYMSDPKFPKPIYDSPRLKLWSGRSLEYYFDKLAGR